MNPIQNLKMQLLDKYGDASDKKSIDFCREAYKFLTEEGKANAKDDKPESSEAVAVDLGLPSGTLWADRNVGADSPSDFGLYYSWGNLIGSIIGSECDFYSDEYDKTPGKELDGDIDLDHDVARFSMGEPWQMPTKDQFIELVDNCTTEWCHENGHVGMRFTSKINGNSVFFPAAGRGNGTSLYNVGSLGLYWSSAWYSADYAYIMLFDSSTVYPQYVSNRCYGFSVRAVQNSPTK